MLQEARHVNISIISRLIMQEAADFILLPLGDAVPSLRIFFENLSALSLNNISFLHDFYFIIYVR